MKKLIVFYSRTGNTKKIADKIAKNLECDYEEINDTKNRKGPIGFMTSGREAMKENLTSIKQIKKDPSEYDLTIIGTPVWANNVSSPIRTYLSKNKFKKVAFFCTTGGIGIEKCFKKMEEVCKKKPIATLGLSSKELENSEKINNFIKKLK